MPDFDVVVIGAGPAGLAAACRAAESGARVAMVDDNPAPGGQIWRASSGKIAAAVEPWLRIVKQHNVEWIAGARVFAAGDGRVLLESDVARALVPAGSTLVSSLDSATAGYQRLVLATGARERFLPFPGWTLPNVMGAGGLQALAKSGLPVAGKKVVVAGSGPLLLAVARYMQDHGADVRLIAEQALQNDILRFGLGLIRYPGKLLEAIRLQASLWKVPYNTSCWPIAAEGNEKLEAVTLRRGSETWKVACDYLACGFGLVPNTEVAALLGCEMNAAGVAVDEFQQTSVEGVYSAGEATGIGGLELSLVEGEIAGYAAARRPERARNLFGARVSHRGFADALDRTFALREELKSLPQESTFVCRCEDVTFEAVRQCSGWREAKLHTRCGMGPCQGRVCGTAVEFLFGWRADSVRPPLFPVRVESLAKLEERVD